MSVVGHIHEAPMGWCLVQGNQKTAVNGQVYYPTRGELSEALRGLGLHPRQDKSVTKDSEPETADSPAPQDPKDPALKYGDTGPANEPTEDDVLKYAAKGDAPKEPEKKASDKK